MAVVRELIGRSRAAHSVTEASNEGGRVFIGEILKICQINLITRLKLGNRRSLQLAWMLKLMLIELPAPLLALQTNPESRIGTAWENSSMFPVVSPHFIQIKSNFVTYFCRSLIRIAEIMFGGKRRDRSHVSRTFLHTRS